MNLKFAKKKDLYVFNTKRKGLSLEEAKKQLESCMKERD